MNYEIVALKEKITAGISARTNNADSGMTTVIGDLWKRFYNDGIYASIPNKMDAKALGIYMDYDGNEKDDYTVLAACEVCEEPADEKFTVHRIPAGCYAKFTIKGDMNTVVAEAWQAIWKMDLPRTFVCDFEEYQNNDVKHSEIHIYIGLKEGENVR